MTIADTLQGFANTARLKADLFEHNLPGFVVSAMMAGAYVGMGILLIFSVGQGVDASAQPIVMGASFGIALTLVIFAGSELFTGHTMYMMQGRLMGSVSTSELCKTWVGSWLGNLLGAAGLGMIFVVGSSELVLEGDGNSLLHAVAAKKMNAPSFELVARAILCNWLVCLAIWMSSRTKSDTAKCVLIFWLSLRIHSGGIRAQRCEHDGVFSCPALRTFWRDLRLGGYAQSDLGNARQCYRRSNVYGGSLLAGSRSSPVPKRSGPSAYKKNHEPIKYGARGTGLNIACKISPVLWLDKMERTRNRYQSLNHLEG